jgi:predicted flap endonuclease-1-like 5' DNA nuclease
MQHLGILSSMQLWQQSLSAITAEQLAEKLQMPTQQVLKWSAMADLAQVPGVGCIYAGVLLHVGVCSSVQLAKASADSLHQQIMRLQVRTMSRDQKLSVGLVNQWIMKAQETATAQRQVRRRVAARA